jgi:hypothetical protein
MIYRPYSSQEDRIVLDAFFAGSGTRQIRLKLRLMGFERTRSSVAAACRRLKLVGPLKEETPENINHPIPFAANPYYLAADRRFKIAMIAAIKAGKEHARYGVTVATTVNTRAKFIPAVPQYSGCSSPAGLCADLGSPA